jgi:hypothetical protein
MSARGKSFVKGYHHKKGVSIVLTQQYEIEGKRIKSKGYGKKKSVYNLTGSLWATKKRYQHQK